MKHILLVLFSFLSLSVFGQVQDTAFLTGKVQMSQSGAGSGYWQVSGTFTDESGLFDSGSIEVGDILFFSDAGIGYHLPITNIVSASPPSFVVRVSNVGITNIISVPTGSGVIYRPSSADFLNYTSGISNPDQQTYLSYLSKKLDALGVGGNGIYGGSGLLPNSLVEVGNTQGIKFAAADEGTLLFNKENGAIAFIKDSYTDSLKHGLVINSATDSAAIGVDKDGKLQILSNNWVAIGNDQAKIIIRKDDGIVLIKTGNNVYSLADGVPLNGKNNVMLWPNGSQFGRFSNLDSLVDGRLRKDTTVVVVDDQAVVDFSFSDTRKYSNVYFVCKGVSDTALVTFLSFPLPEQLGTVFHVKSDSGNVALRLIGSQGINNKGFYLLKNGQRAEVRALWDAVGNLDAWEVVVVWDFVNTALGNVNVDSLVKAATESGFLTPNTIPYVDGNGRLNSRGFEEFGALGSAPSAPSGGFRFYADATGRPSWRRADGFTRTFDATITGNRVFTLQDKSYTLADNADVTALQSTVAGLGSTYFPLAGGSVTGTGGAGFVGLPAQSSAPGTPGSGFRLFADASGRFTWKGSNGYLRVFDGVANTADRTYTLQDISGTIAMLEAGQTWTGVNRFNGFTGFNVAPTSFLHITPSYSSTGDLSGGGYGFRLATATYTNTSTAASGTVGSASISSFDGGTIASTNTDVTYTNVATLRIAAAPTAGANTTIANPWSLEVASGSSFFGGDLFLGASRNIIFGPSGAIGNLRIRQRWGGSVSSSLGIGSNNTDNIAYGNGGLFYGNRNTFHDAQNFIFGNLNTISSPAIGYVFGASNTVSTNTGLHIVIGNNNTASAYTNGQHADIVVGSSNNTNGFWGGGMYGTAIKYYANAQLLFGGNSGNVDFSIKSIYIGYGYRNENNTTSANNGNGNNLLISPSLSASATDKNGGNLTLAAGLGTGAGTPGDLIFATGSTTVSGASDQVSVERFRIKANGGFIGQSFTDAQISAIPGVVNNLRIFSSTSERQNIRRTAGWYQEAFLQDIKRDTSYQVVNTSLDISGQTTNFQNRYHTVRIFTAVTASATGNNVITMPVPSAALLGVNFKVAAEDTSGDADISQISFGTDGTDGYLYNGDGTYQTTFNVPFGYGVYLSVAWCQAKGAYRWVLQ